jgi:hypothetical protein
VKVIASVAALTEETKRSAQVSEKMRRLEVTVWYVVLYVYSFQRLFVDLIPEFETPSRYVHLISDVAIGFLGVRCFWRKGGGFTKVLAVLFLVTSTLSYVGTFGQLTFLSHLNGMRDYLVLFGAYAFANYAIEGSLRELFVRRFTRFIKVFLVSQIPVALYLFSKYGAGDKVGGTFGVVGGSGMLTLAIFCLGFYLVSVHWNQKALETFSIRNNLKMLPFFLPTLINETKITLVFLGLFFMLQFKLTLRAAITNAALLGFMFAAFLVYDNYVASTGTSDVVFRERFLEEYLFGEYREGHDIPRGTKIMLTLEAIQSEAASLLFGAGIGLFKGGNILELSDYAREYSWLTEGTRPYIVFLLGGGGLVNTFIILALLFYPLLRRERGAPAEWKEGSLSKRLGHFVLAVLVLILVYKDSLRHGCIMMIMATLSMIVYHGIAARTEMKEGASSLRRSG